MEKLKKQELISTQGGALRVGLATLIATGIALIVGIVDGFMRPQACRR